jgi:hypothetical protein
MTLSINDFQHTALYHYAKCRNAEFHVLYCNAECHNAECHYSECRYAECFSAGFYTLFTMFTPFVKKVSGSQPSRGKEAKKDDATSEDRGISGVLVN